jgi:D-alanyl-D-alanine carboxypeptidase
MVIPGTSPFSRSFLVLGILASLLVTTSVLPDYAEAGSAKERTKKKVVQKAHRKKTAEKNQPRVRAKAVYCVNLASNRTLMTRNPDRQLPVASLTKLVTALVVLDKFPLNRKIRVPQRIKRVPKSVVGLKPGDRVSVKDLLHGLLIGSGNDCAETVARAYPGGRKRFIAAMNKRARAMGTRRTRFYTPSGLDRKRVFKKRGKRLVKITSNVSTAREIARIARLAFANKTIRSICLKKRYVMASTKSKGGYRIKNTNKLLRGNLPIEGGKTGYTSRAGHCLATKFTPGRNILLIVVLGSPDHFRDTRLVYRKALKKSKSAKTKSRSRRTHHRNRSAGPVSG